MLGVDDSKGDIDDEQKVGFVDKIVEAISVDEESNEGVFDGPNNGNNGVNNGKCDQGTYDDDDD